MANQESLYQSYLLRLWLVENETHNSWRFSLENVQTGERQGFASLEALCADLSEKIATLPGVSPVNDVVVE